MPGTALAHFNDDIGRARAIVAHADPLPQTTDAERVLRSDLFRSAWMFAVGALDAYFCDAYTDVVAATIISIKVIEDVEFLVNRCDEHITTEMPHFLSANGCTAAIIAQAGY